ncbi:MAG: helix-hairpin-helix domain-containing protein [Chloroflexi bacterium]|nr:helix-hairpin-helix domain-containing protein [Chloroflexota bacterium]
MVGIIALLSQMTAEACPGQSLDQRRTTDDKSSSIVCRLSSHRMCQGGEMDAQPEKIDLNQAGAETLAELPGIGPNLARRIVEYRQAVGPFEEVIELAAVPGVSERMVRAIADQLSVGAAPADVSPAGEAPEEETASLVRLVITEEEIGPAEPEIPAKAAPEPETTLDAAPADPAPAPVAVPMTRSEIITRPAVVAQPMPLARPARSGSTFWAVAFGAVLGMILTLAVLAWLNGGTLRFASATTAGNLQQELQQEAAAARSERESLAGELAALRQQAGTLSQQADDLAQQQAALRQALNETQTDVSGLEETAEALDERITSLAAAADTFNTFLNSLRDLLFELQGPPPATTPAATPAGSRPPGTPTPTPQATGQPEAATATLQPTRTPRPTATPLGVPAATVEP